MLDIAVPEGLWDTSKTPEGVVANWFYRDGSTVEAGAKIAELMVEKTVFDIAAPAAGELAALLRPGEVPCAAFRDRPRPRRACPAHCAESQTHLRARGRSLGKEACPDRRRHHPSHQRQTGNGPVTPCVRCLRR